MKRLLILAGLILLVGVGIWLVRPVYLNWKQQRALRQAQEFFARDDFRNAALCARQALRVNPGNAEATRLMGDIVEKLRAPGLVAWRQRLVEVEPANPVNHRRLVEACLRAGNAARAAQALARTDPTNLASVPFLELRAMVAVTTNNLPAAEALYADALRLAPTNRLLQLNRAVVRAQSSDAAAAAGGRYVLEQLAADPALRKSALDNLVTASLRARDHDKALSYSRQSIAGPDATFDARLRHLTVLREINSAELLPSLGQLQAEAAANPQEIHVLCGWLLERRMNDEASRWLTSLPASTRARQPVVMAQADCALAASDWSRLLSLLKDVHWGEADFLRHAMQARACRELRQPVASDAEWRAATQAAGDLPHALAGLVRMAGAWGWTREHDALLWTVVQRFPREDWALEALSQAYTARRDTRGLFRVYSTILADNPSDLVARNNFAAIALLLNVQTNQAHQLAKEIYAKAPESAAIASTHAFSLYLQGRTVEALQVMEKLPARALDHPTLAAYYGAMLAATGNKEKARLFLDLGAHANLLPEEKAMLDAALASVR